MSIDASCNHSQPSSSSSQVPILQNLPLSVPPPISTAQTAIQALGHSAHPPSFLEQCKLRMSQHVTSAMKLIPDLAKIVADYLMVSEDAFGARQWEEHFGCKVGPETPFPEALFQFWFGLDPLDSDDQICDTHFPPIFRPQTVTDITSNTPHPFTLERLQKIVENPKKGPAVTYKWEIIVREQHGRTKAGPPCWLLVRKNIASQGLSDDGQMRSVRAVNRETQAGYEERPHLLDISTVIFSRYVSTEKYCFEEMACLPYSVCVEKVTYTMLVEKNRYITGVFQAVVGGLNRGHLNVHSRKYDFTSGWPIGVALLRKF